MWKWTELVGQLGRWEGTLLYLVVLSILLILISLWVTVRLLMRYPSRWLHRKEYYNRVPTIVFTRSGNPVAIYLDGNVTQMSSEPRRSPLDGLLDRAETRELVVVGDQSSGKSSVLEGLTGFSFPRAAGLCTRYATQITCRRAAELSIVISIIPRPNADEETKKQLLEFKHELPEMNNDKLIKIFDVASAVMGIKMSKTDTHDGRAAFSQDILKIEISGPDQDHLTVIDVPGIFRVATPGLTTESDITLVENMVKSYMNDRRTIILAIVPCNVDIATQEILKLAEKADPAGVRTMGVLTKPDLATEEASKDTIRDLVLGKSSNLKLGYHVVKNRGADDRNSTLSDCLAAEEDFFMGSTWSSIIDHCGITSLKPKLRALLMNVSKQAIPQVKTEIEHNLQACKGKLGAMGPARGDDQAQRLYLTKLASSFQGVTTAALNGYYASHKIFKTDPNLKLITRMMKLNEDFSNTFQDRGHKLCFGSGWVNDDNEDSDMVNVDNLSLEVLSGTYPELSDILHGESYLCPMPSDSPIMGFIEDVFASSRGPELGTFGGTVLATAFAEQTEKWEDLVLSHTSKAIILVHDYIFQLLGKLCPEEQVREQLWNEHLVDKLCDAYRRAMTHANWLLGMERGGRPTTFDRYFNATLQQKRGERMVEALVSMARPVDVFKGGAEYVSIEDIRSHAQDKNNAHQVCEDILDTLMSYYKVSSKRFVDVVCQQVVLHFLLEGEDNPLKILGPELVMGLKPDELEAIAGEDSESKRQRKALVGRKERLEAALKVLRT
ncbi:interferon-induced GTP-binding protein mx2 [Apiospora marii]|uniref:Interferon-induced GTP-binding protein mx2 n=1 Tax=Apiospora marii TaxID=335849 RepID=A0ABR1RGY5_9PEZI